MFSPFLLLVNGEMDEESTKLWQLRAVLAAMDLLSASLPCHPQYV